MSNVLKLWIGICDKQIISQGFGYHPQYQTLTITNSQADSCVLGDNSGDNQNATR